MSAKIRNLRTVSAVCGHFRKMFFIRNYLGKNQKRVYFRSVQAGLREGKKPLENTLIGCLNRGYEGKKAVENTVLIRLQTD